MTRRPSARLRPSLQLQHLLGIELLLSLLAVAICLTAAVAEAPVLTGKAQASGRFFAVRPAQLEMMERIAMQGELPAAAEPVLGMRPAESRQESAAHLLWLCGGRQPPAGFTAPPATVSASASAPSFSVCREGRASW